MENDRALPEGTVTFLFTDIEGSTRLLQHLGDRYPAVLAEHHRLLRRAVQQAGGHELDTAGDGFFIAFERARDAVTAAMAAQRAFAEHEWPEGAAVRVRMGIHTGEPTRTAENYTGIDVHRAARLAAAGHGGQILLSAATRTLIEQDLPEGTSLRDLGLHRLKDLRCPEPIFQIVYPDLPSDFPPLNSLGRYAHNLPVEPTSLLGREEELAATRNLLRRADVRLLTLTGPGGTGKTRLALQLTADLLDDFSGGVFFVPLAPIRDANLVPAAIAHALGLPETGGQSLLQSLKDHLKDRQVLLFLDNSEQVLSASSVVAELLAACPRLKVLVTSRSSLHLRSEKEFAVPPLALPGEGVGCRVWGVGADKAVSAGTYTLHPTPDALMQFPAVALFVARARDVKHNFELTGENAAAVAEICRRLDGLPLAIELAAARIRLLSPQAMLARLTNRLKLLTGGAVDLPERQQTLREAIAWSYDLLSEGERQLFRRLSVFVAGCTLEAAEAVCNGAGDLKIDLIDGMEALVDQSLLRQVELGPRAGSGEPRFVMLETIREYGRECLSGAPASSGLVHEAGGPDGASEEATSIQRQHMDYFRGLAEAAEARLTGADRGEWLARLEADHDNLRAALEWSQESGDIQSGLRLAGALCDFWVVRGHWSEAQERLIALLARPGAEARTAFRARALHTAARLAYCRGEIPTAHALYDESLAIHRELGNRPGTASALNGLADVARLQGELETARSFYAEAVALYRELGDRWRITFSLSGLGDVARLQGDLETARSFYEESLKIRRELGDRRATTVSLNGLGHVAQLQGDLETAQALYRDSLVINRDLGDKRGITFSLSGLGQVARLQGDLDRAGSMFEECLAINREIGDKRGIAASLNGLGDVARLRGALEAARHLYEEALTLFRELGDQRGIAYALNGVASLQGSGVGGQGSEKGRN